MSDEGNPPVPAGDEEASTGLLLSVEPLREEAGRYATETSNPDDTKSRPIPDGGPGDSADRDEPEPDHPHDEAPPPPDED